MGKLISKPNPNDLIGICDAIAKLDHKLNTGAKPIFAGIGLTGLTASRLIATDADKVLESADLYAWVTETGNQVLIADDGDGTITFSLPQNIHAGASPTFVGLTLSGITLGSMLFAGTSGVVSQDNSNLFWDDTNNRLGIGINTGFDPRTGLTVSGDMDILHTATEADDHAFEIDVDAATLGDVKAIDIVYTTGILVAGRDEGIILINIDEIAATGGNIFGLEVLATDGSAGVYGLKVGAVIGPIHQNSGTFANPTTATDNTTGPADVNAMKDGDIGTTTAIFEALNEYILIGAATTFEEIEFIITTGASGAGIKPTFWYSTAGAHQFTQFTPVDGTNAFRNTGVIAWDASDLTAHGVNTDTGTYDIKIIRTRTSLSTSPILGYAKTAATTEYIWDKDGNVNIKTLAVSTIAAEGSDVDKFLVDSSGIVKYRTGAQILSDVGGQAQGDVLDDLNILGANPFTGDPAADFLVGTAAGTLAWQSGATVRTSLGLGTGDSPTFANYTAANLLTACATSAGGLDFSSDVTLTVAETETTTNYHTDARAATWLAANHETTFTHADIALNTTHRGLVAGNPHSVTPAELSLVIGTNTQAWDAGLDSLAALSYASDSFIKVTAEDTYALRTIAQTADDLEGAIVHDNLASVHQDVNTTAGPSFKKLILIDSTINTTADYRAIAIFQTKTAGVTDKNDDFMGIYNAITYNQTGGVIGTARAAYNLFVHTDGDIGDVTNDRSLEAEHAFADLNAGKIYGNVRGGYFRVDQEAAHEIVGNVYGLQLWMDIDGTVSGASTLLQIRGYNGVDYGIYQLGGTQNYFNSPTGFGVTAPKTQLTIEGALTLKEQAAADGDTAAYGQLWVKNDDPNILMYTNDDGDDFTVNLTPV